IIDGDVNIALASGEGFHGKVGRCTDYWTSWLYTGTISAHSARKNSHHAYLFGFVRGRRGAPGFNFALGYCD
ncbi:hypothetical protein X777_03681, partial [Ooceraea biroi]